MSFVFASFFAVDRVFGAYYPWPILYVRENDINKIMETMIPHPMNEKEKARLRRLVGWVNAHCNEEIFWSHLEREINSRATNSLVSPIGLAAAEPFDFNLIEMEENDDFDAWYSALHWQFGCLIAWSNLLPAGQNGTICDCFNQIYWMNGWLVHEQFHFFIEKLNILLQENALPAKLYIFSARKLQFKERFEESIKKVRVNKRIDTENCRILHRKWRFIGNKNEIKQKSCN